MKKFNEHTYKNETPGDLLDLLGGNQAAIIASSIAGLIEIGRYIAQAIAEGPRKKRIERLEAFQKWCIETLFPKIAQEFADSNAKLSSVESRLAALESSSVTHSITFTPKTP